MTNIDRINVTAVVFAFAVILWVDAFRPAAVFAQSTEQEFGPPEKTETGEPGQGLDLSEEIEIPERDADQLLTFGFESDFEKSYARSYYNGNRVAGKQSPLEATMDFIADFRPFDSMGMYIDYEVEMSTEITGQFSEMYLYSLFETENAEWIIQAGRMDLPFGQSDTEFINGPVLEFGEINETALLSTVELESGFALTVYAFDSDVNTEPGKSELDGGLLLSYESADGAWFSNLGYLTDLGEITEPLHDIEKDTPNSRTPAVSAQIGARYEDFSILIETVAATQAIDTLDTPFDKPVSTSVEMFYEFNEQWYVGGRVEFTDELEDYPEQTVGLTLGYIVDESLSFGVELTQGKFDHECEDDNGNPVDKVNLLTFQASLNF